MSFGGSVASMIATLKNNKSMLGERYSYFDAKKKLSKNNERFENNLRKCNKRRPGPYSKKKCNYKGKKTI